MPVPYYVNSAENESYPGDYQAIEAAQVILELIKLVKEIREAYSRGLVTPGNYFL